MNEDLEIKLNHLKDLTSDRSRRYSKYSHIDLKVVIDLLKEGLTMFQIADLYNCSYQAMQYQLRIQDSKFDARKYSLKTKQSQEKSEEIRGLYEELKSSVKIGKAIGLSATSVLKRLEKCSIKRKSRYREDIAPEEVAKVYKKCKTLKKVAFFFNTDAKVIKRRLKAAGVESVIEHKYYPRRDDIPIEEVLKRYDNEESILSMSNDYDASFQKIRKILVDNNRKIRRGKCGVCRKDVTPEKAARLYKKYKRVNIAAEKLHSNVNTVRDRLKEAGVTIDRNFIYEDRRKDIPEKEVVKMYNSKKSLKKIATKYNSSPYTIKKILVRNKVKIRKSKRDLKR